MLETKPNIDRIIYFLYAIFFRFFFFLIWFSCIHPALRCCYYGFLRAWKFITLFIVRERDEKRCGSRIKSQHNATFYYFWCVCARAYVVPCFRIFGPAECPLSYPLPERCMCPIGEASSASGMQNNNAEATSVAFTAKQQQQKEPKNDVSYVSKTLFTRIFSANILMYFRHFCVCAKWPELTRASQQMGVVVGVYRL